MKNIENEKVLKRIASYISTTKCNLRSKCDNCPVYEDMKCRFNGTSTEIMNWLMKGGEEHENKI